MDEDGAIRTTGTKGAFTIGTTTSVGGVYWAVLASLTAFYSYDCIAVLQWRYVFGLLDCGSHRC